MTEKLYNLGYCRAGRIFGKFHETKACCQHFPTRLSIKDFKMTKNDKQVYNRFLNFLRGNYKLSKGEKEEEKEIMKPEKWS